MKRIISLVLVCISLVLAAGCASSSDYSSSNNESQISYDPTPTPTPLSKEEIMEYYALKEIYNFLNEHYSESYDVSATQYKMGAIDGNYVYVTLYLYDKKFGDFEKTKRICVQLRQERDGTYSAIDRPHWVG